jgi:pimeloyl-ACP methyl ester carboxylesterase
MEPLRRQIQGLWPTAEIVVPKLPLSLFSLADPSVVAARVAQKIDKIYREGRFESIVLVGHSVGALIARKAYLIACGEQDRAPFEDRLREALGVEHRLFAGFDWHRAVDRIVLLAAMNRGWRVSHHISLLHAPIWALGSLIGEVIHLATLMQRRPLILMVRRGAEFITNLRVQWIVRRITQNAAGIDGPLTIQLLGSQDDMVAPDDNVDLVSGSNFIYLDVPYSTHANVVEVEGQGAPLGRMQVIRDALTMSQSELSELAVLPSDDSLATPELQVTSVAFVIHGIRDAGYWTHKIARRVRKLGERKIGSDGRQERWATETSSYGYFPMAPFLSPVGRREKVEWMMDQYTEALARYPCAKFYYVGHSNGTYLLAKALQLYPACRFERVVFAGSVVRRKYKWSHAIERGQIASVLNFVGTADWVVAFFPRLFEFVPVQDLGGAGHLGFKVAGPGRRLTTESQETPVIDVTRPKIQNRLARGSHDAGIREHMWDDIAAYLLDAVVPADTPAPRSWLVRVLGSFPPLVWGAILAVLYCTWLLISRATPDGFTEGFVFALYLGAVVFVLRRV